MLIESRRVGDASDSVAQPRAIIINKEKCSILDYRTAQRKAKLVALILGSFLAGGREEVARVERAVAKELIGGAVELIGAGLQDDVYLCADVSAKRCVIAAGQHL